MLGVVLDPVQHCSGGRSSRGGAGAVFSDTRFVQKGYRDRLHSLPLWEQKFLGTEVQRSESRQELRFRERKCRGTKSPQFGTTTGENKCLNTESMKFLNNRNS